MKYIAGRTTSPQLTQLTCFDKRTSHKPERDLQICIQQQAYKFLVVFRASVFLFLAAESLFLILPSKWRAGGSSVQYRACPELARHPRAAGTGSISRGHVPRREESLAKTTHCNPSKHERKTKPAWSLQTRLPLPTPEEQQDHDRLGEKTHVQGRSPMLLYPSTRASPSVVG